MQINFVMGFDDITGRPNNVTPSSSRPNPGRPSTSPSDGLRRSSDNLGRPSVTSRTSSVRSRTSAGSRSSSVDTGARVSAARRVSTAEPRSASAGAARTSAARRSSVNDKEKNPTPANKGQSLEKGGNTTCACRQGSVMSGSRSSKLSADSSLEFHSISSQNGRKRSSSVVEGRETVYYSMDESSEPKKSQNGRKRSSSFVEGRDTVYYSMDESSEPKKSQNGRKRSSSVVEGRDTVYYSMDESSEPKKSQNGAKRSSSIEDGRDTVYYSMDESSEPKKSGRLSWLSRLSEARGSRKSKSISEAITDPSKKKESAVAGETSVPKRKKSSLLKTEAMPTTPEDKGENSPNIASGVDPRRGSRGRFSSFRSKSSAGKERRSSAARPSTASESSEPVAASSTAAAVASTSAADPAPDSSLVAVTASTSTVSCVCAVPDTYVAPTSISAPVVPAAATTSTAPKSISTPVVVATATTPSSTVPSASIAAAAALAAATATKYSDPESAIAAIEAADPNAAALAKQHACDPAALAAYAAARGTDPASLTCQGASFQGYPPDFYAFLLFLYHLSPWANLFSQLSPELPASKSDVLPERAAEEGGAGAGTGTDRGHVVEEEAAALVSTMLMASVAAIAAGKPATDPNVPQSPRVAVAGIVEARTMPPGPRASSMVQFSRMPGGQLHVTRLDLQNLDQALRYFDIFLRVSEPDTTSPETRNNLDGGGGSQNDVGIPDSDGSVPSDLATEQGKTAPSDSITHSGDLFYPNTLQMGQVCDETNNCAEDLKNDNPKEFSEGPEYDEINSNLKDPNNDVGTVQENVDHDSRPPDAGYGSTGTDSGALTQKRSRTPPGEIENDCPGVCSKGMECTDCALYEEPANKPPGAVSGVPVNGSSDGSSANGHGDDGQRAPTHDPKNPPGQIQQGCLHVCPRIPECDDIYSTCGDPAQETSSLVSGDQAHEHKITSSDTASELSTHDEQSILSGENGDCRLEHCLEKCEAVCSLPEDTGNANPETEPDIPAGEDEVIHSEDPGRDDLRPDDGIPRDECSEPDADGIELGVTVIPCESPKTQEARLCSKPCDDENLEAGVESIDLWCACRVPPIATSDPSAMLRHVLRNPSSRCDCTNDEAGDDGDEKDGGDAAISSSQTEQGSPAALGESQPDDNSRPRGNAQRGNVIPMKLATATYEGGALPMKTTQLECYEVEFCGPLAQKCEVDTVLKKSFCSRRNENYFKSTTEEEKNIITLKEKNPKEFILDQIIPEEFAHDTIVRKNRIEKCVMDLVQKVLKRGGFIENERTLLLNFIDTILNERENIDETKTTEPVNRVSLYRRNKSVVNMPETQKCDVDTLFKKSFCNKRDENYFRSTTEGENVTILEEKNPNEFLLDQIIPVEFAQDTLERKNSIEERVMELVQGILLRGSFIENERTLLLNFIETILSEGEEINETEGTQNQVLVNRRKESVVNMSEKRETYKIGEDARKFVDMVTSDKKERRKSKGREIDGKTKKLMDSIVILPSEVDKSRFPIETQDRLKDIPHNIKKSEEARDIISVEQTGLLTCENIETSLFDKENGREKSLNKIITGMQNIMNKISPQLQSNKSKMRNKVNRGMQDLIKKTIRFKEGYNTILNKSVILNEKELQNSFKTIIEMIIPDEEIPNSRERHDEINNAVEELLEKLLPLSESRQNNELRQIRDKFEEFFGKLLPHASWFAYNSHKIADLRSTTFQKLKEIMENANANDKKRSFLMNKKTQRVLHEFLSSGDIYDATERKRLQTEGLDEILETIIRIVSLESRSSIENIRTTSTVGMKKSTISEGIEKEIDNALSKLSKDDENELQVLLAVRDFLGTKSSLSEKEDNSNSFITREKAKNLVEQTISKPSEESIEKKSFIQEEDPKNPHEIVQESNIYHAEKKRDIYFDVVGLMDKLIPKDFPNKTNRSTMQEGIQELFEKIAPLQETEKINEVSDVVFRFVDQIHSRKKLKESQRSEEVYRCVMDFMCNCVDPTESAKLMEDLEELLKDCVAVSQIEKNIEARSKLRNKAQPILERILVTCIREGRFQESDIFDQESSYSDLDHSRSNFPIQELEQQSLSCLKRKSFFGMFPWLTKKLSRDSKSKIKGESDTGEKVSKSKLKVDLKNKSKRQKS